MGLFSTRAFQLACARCGSAIGRAEHRTWPPLLEVRDVAGAPLASERAGRILQRRESAPKPVDSELHRWLSGHAVEVAYELSCPVHGDVVALAPAIAAAVRRSDRGARWARVPTR